MRYSIYKIADETKQSIGQILFHKGDWYLVNGKGPEEIGQLLFPTPEEAALWHGAHEFI